MKVKVQVLKDGVGIQMEALQLEFLRRHYNTESEILFRTNMELSNEKTPTYSSEFVVSTVEIGA